MQLGPLEEQLIEKLWLCGSATVRELIEEGKLELAYTTYVWLGGHRDQLVPGWTSLVLILTIASAITMILQGILGIYVGMIFREVKRRPVYLVRK